MSVEVIARQATGATVAGAIAIIVDEWLVNNRANPVMLASILADGKDVFKRAWPVSLRKNAGAYGRAMQVDMSAHAIDVAIDTDQLTLRVWDELGRYWASDHPGYSPRTFLDFGGDEMWERATAPPPTLMDLDDIEIDSCSDERIHNQIFEGSARHRKGRIHELGIKPNHLSGEIFPGSHDARPTPGPVQQQSELAPAGVPDE